MAKVTVKTHHAASGKKSRKSFLSEMISLFAENRARKGIFAFPCSVAFSPVYSAAHPYGEENTNDVFI